MHLVLFWGASTIWNQSNGLTECAFLLCSLAFRVLAALWLKWFTVHLSIFWHFSAFFTLALSLAEDDVDLEALVNDMNSSLESLYSTCSAQQTESTPLLHNGQPTSSHHHHHHHHMQHNQPRQSQHSHGLSHVSPELPSSSSSSGDSPQTGLRRSQPMHILAVR